MCVRVCLAFKHLLLPPTTAPTGQSSPDIVSTSATSVDLTWEPPSQPNGNISGYIVQRRTPSLLSYPAYNDVGVSFTGNGYATFIPSNPSSFENELSLRFRTYSCCGVLFYAINGAETDMIAVELRNGVPWLVFDAGSGPGAVKPDGDTVFNDGEWHTLTVTQRGTTGSITVDITHTGTVQSLGSSTVIGYSTHYVGGLPSDAALHTLNAEPGSSSVLSGHNFAGCLHGVIFNEVALDFSIGFPGVGLPSSGCPVNLTPGVQLLGAGYFSLVENTITGSNFSISFEFRTTHSDGILFFLLANGGIRCAIELQNSALNLIFADSEAIILNEACDGGWHSVNIHQDDTQLIVTVDETLLESYTLPGAQSDILTSSVFFGGIPSDSSELYTALDAGLNIHAPFSGCVRLRDTFLYVNDQPVAGFIAESESVNFDGCGSSVGTNCTLPWQEIDTGVGTSLSDTNLTPFSGAYTLNM